MRSALLIALLALCACRQGTSVLVRVSNNGLVVPADLASLRIVATNPELGSEIVYQSADLALCAAVPSAGCYELPISVALRPGDARPEARVRVELTAFDAQGGVVTRDAALFSFADGQQQQLDFTLSPRCLRTACAEQDRACGQSGGCVSLVPAIPMPVPDQALPPPVGGPIVRWYDAGVYSSTGDVLTTLPPQGTRPGDLVVAWIQALDAPAGWTVIAIAGNRKLAVRRAADAEGSATAAYTFPKPNGDVFPARLLLLAYRGVERFEVGFAGARAPGDVFPSFPVAAGGALAVHLIGLTSTACTIEGTAVAAPYSEGFWDDWGPLPAGPSGPRSIACGTIEGAAQLWLYPR